MVVKRIQETEYRRQETGDRIQKPELKYAKINS